MWQILPLILLTTPYLAEMNMHPLYSTLQALKNSRHQKAENFLPVPEKNLETQPVASTRIEKMGCLVLAGGQGTRLGVHGPKGCVELPLKEKKSLFQLLFEKIQAKGKTLHFAIMTSPLNHVGTVQYLEDNAYFGLDPKTISIFQQGMIEVSDEEGYVFFDRPGQLAQAPSGNGHALYHFYQSGVWAKWQTAGIEVVQVLPIDNPLADPFDAELLGVHESSGVELVLKCIKRDDPEEKLGVIGVEEGLLTIREYSELTERMKHAKQGDKLQFFLGYSGLFSCTMGFIEKVQSVALPWHLAKKQGVRMTQVEGKWQSEKIPVWKFEAFIFDLFPYAETFQIILGDRKKCFAPLKNRTGPDSFEAVVQAINEK